MASYHWAKVWIEILYDYKMAMLDDHLWRRTIEIILLAKERNEGGYLPPLPEMAFKLHTSPEMLEAELNDLAKVSIAELRGGRWFITNFDKRQGAMTDAERKARQRERDNKQEYHGLDTEQTQDGHELVTNRDTDKKRKEKEEEKNGGVVLDVPEVLATLEFDAAWKQWLSHLKEKRLGLTKQQANLELARLAEMGHDEAIEAIRYSIRKGWKGIYPPSDNGYSGGSAKGRSAGQLVLNHIKTYGTRKKLKADDATLDAVRRAGGLGKLGQMPERDVINAIANSYEEIPA